MFVVVEFEMIVPGTGIGNGPTEYETVSEKVYFDHPFCLREIERSLRRAYGFVRNMKIKEAPHA